MDTLTKILIGFMDIQSFAKMIDEEKYSVKYAFRWQYGGSCIDVFKDGILISQKENLGERAPSKTLGYNIILDHWAERNGFQWRDDMQDGGLHIRISEGVKGMYPTFTETQLKEKEKELFSSNWNKMVDAVKKYNP